MWMYVVKRSELLAMLHRGPVLTIVLQIKSLIFVRQQTQGTVRSQTLVSICLH